MTLRAASDIIQMGVALNLMQSVFSLDAIIGATFSMEPDKNRFPSLHVSVMFMKS